MNPDTGGIVLSSDILFAPGKVDLRSAGTEMLQRLVSELLHEEYQECQIEIAGHTDSDPIKRSSWEDNWQLSAERARKVLSFLVESGIEPERLCLSGYGPHCPRDGDKAQQRRVEVVLRAR